MYVTPLDSRPDFGTISIQAIDQQRGHALITLAIPEETLPLMRDLLQDGITLINSLIRKARFQKALDRVHDPVEVDKREDDYRKFSEGILAKFDAFVAAGSTPREAIRRTKSTWNKNGGAITCQMIELVVRNAGRLRKNAPCVSTGN